MKTQISQKSFFVRCRICVFAYFAFFLIYFIHKTLRYTVVGGEHYESAKKIHPLGSMLIAVWHKNTILSVTSLSKSSFQLLVSSSLDGEMISFVAKKMGLSSFRGSSSRGGIKALFETKRFLNTGGKLAIAVDGPRGPALEPKAGVIFLSKKTSAAILPMSSVASEFWTLKKTWDHFRIPKPFSRVVITYGSPILSSEASESVLKSALNSLESK